MRINIAEFDKKIIAKFVTFIEDNGCSLFDTREFSATGKDKEWKLYVFIKKLVDGQKLNHKYIDELEREYKRLGINIKEV